MHLDLRVDVGVPGWIDDTGRHVTLGDVATPARVEEHRSACILLALSLAKLQWELDDAEQGRGAEISDAPTPHRDSALLFHTA